MKTTDVREKVIALFCLTVLAILALVKLPNPENIVINVIVAIAAFITGGGIRKDDRT